MRTMPLKESALVLSGIFWAGTMFVMGEHRARAAPQPAAAAAPQLGTRAAQGAPPARGRTRVDSGVWRHFDESQSALQTAPSNTGVWHHFGESGVAPAARAIALPTRTARTASPASAPGSASARSVPLQTYRPVPQRPELLHPANANLADLEQQMYTLVNSQRGDPANAAETGGQAQTLRWNEQLAAVARAHSENMLRERFFNHVDPEGRSPADRVTAAGIPWCASGENIALAGSMTSAEDAFMNEPRFEHNHRANILSPKYTDVGVGIVQGLDGQLYITQEFVGTSAGM